MSKENKKPKPWISDTGYPGEQTENEGTNAGSGNNPQCKSHEKTAEITAVGFTCCLAQSAGEAQFPKAEETRGKNDEY